MKKISRLVAFFVFSFLLTGLVSQAAELSLSFTNSGNNFIYSDSPESFNVDPNCVNYLYGASLGTSYKDVEFYHHLRNGWGSASTSQYEVGVAIQNLNSTSVTITYRKGNIVNIDNAGKDDFALGQTPNALKSFLSAGTSTVVIPAYGKTIVWSSKGTISAKERFVFGHAQFRSNKASNVYMRVFVKGQNKTVDDVFKVEKPLNPESQFFSGELNYTQKNTTISASNLNSTYRIFSWPNNYNKNEYTGVIYSKPGGQSVSAGNFGVIYNITINNASGKTLYIKPYKTPASIVYSINNAAWVVNNKNDQSSWKLVLGNSSTANVKIILPGGNHGNFRLAFANIL